MNIIITTSGLGKRLGDLTKYTNKSLVRVGNKFTICYIIEKYPKNSKFIITLGYYGKFVRDFLEITYPELNFTFVNIDKYQGKGSSLGYSLSKIKEYINQPFIYHCCDCIFKDSIDIEQLKENTYFVYSAEKNSNNANLFSSVNVQGDSIYKINDKGFLDFDYVYIGVAYIKDFKIFFNVLNTLIHENKFSQDLSDIHVLRDMIQNYKIKLNYKIIYDWYDMGTIKTFNKANEYLKCNYNILHKNNESLCFLDNKVIKFFYNKNIIKNRVERGKMLYPLGPQILDYNDNYFIMEYIDGTVLSQLYNHGEIKKLLYWAKENLWLSNNKYVGNFKEICYNFYYTKTIKRINDYNLIHNNYEVNTINGINIGSIHNLIKKIDFDYLCDNKPFNYHGDFILDNILKTNDGYCLLDWRQDFGGDIKNGDIYYDLAKLRHNIIINHKNMEEKLYNITKYNNKCDIDVKCNYFLIQQLKDFDEFVNKNNFDLKKIKILTSLIWINISPLHDFSMSEFLFHFGKYNLHLVLN
jgi:NDP-sugar pyrophosphorylase family protein